MVLHQLPDELIENIFSYLDGDDILEVSCVNHRFNGLCSSHTLWYNVFKQLNISNPFAIGYSLEFLQDFEWKELRSLHGRAIKKWGWLLGIWKRQFPAFGGMLLARMEMSPCRIVGYDIQAIDLAMNLVPMLVINIDRSEAGVYHYGGIDFNDFCGICCTLYSTTEHYVNIIKDCERTTSSSNMKICCQQRGSLKDHDLEAMKSDFRASLGMNHAAIPQAIVAAFEDGGINYTKIEKPLVSTESPIIPSGYFAGDYSAHECEIVSLESNVNSIFITKISGDRYVRSGAVSIHIDTTYSLNYLEILCFIARQPWEFNVKQSLEKFHSSATTCSELTTSYIPEDIVLQLKNIGGFRTFGINESDGSFVAAFKGKITLNGKPNVAVPEYYYHEVIAVITDEDTVCLYVPYDESYVGLHKIKEMLLCRLSFG